MTSPSLPSRAAPAEAPAPAGPAPRPAPALSPGRRRAALVLLGAVVLYGVAEALVWRGSLWGFHFYGFYPRWLLLAAPATLLLLTPLGARLVPASPGAGRAPRWLPWLAGGAAAALFWLARERHLFWGDATPLSIFIPQGQKFHPDEPLTLFVHHLLYRAGGGRLAGAEAVALGSALAGGVFTGWTLHWFSRRRPGGGAWWLAAAVVLAQGAMQIFFGHVENYSYLAVCLLLFATLGADFLEGRRVPLPALAAGLLAFAFHILGGLLVLPALVLVVAGLRDRGRRGATLLAVGAVAVALVAASLAAAGLYGAESPAGRFLGGFRKVLTNQTDFRTARLFSLRQAGNVWSVLWLVGPLSAPLLAALLAILPRGAFLRSARGLFLLAAVAAYLGPVLLAGEGNLGAARNWDLHAAPFVFAALAGVLLVADAAPAADARRLLLALLAVSLFHTVPWIALNASHGRTVARILALPLDRGRGPMMLGTYHFNRGELGDAERWFRASLALDSTNVNSQSGLGLTLARQGRHEEGLVHMRRAVALKPGSAQMRYDLVAMLLELERWPEAAREIALGLQYEPRHRPSWLTLADCRLRLSQPDSAAYVLEDGLGYFPGDPEMERLLADSYSLWVATHGRRGERDAARTALARFAARFPQDPRVATLRAALAPER